MEDDDGISGLLLYCHEDPLLVSSTPAGADEDDTATGGISSVLLLPQPAADMEIVREESSLLAEEQQEELMLVEHMMSKQGCYAPSRGYLDHLLQEQGAGVAAARSKGVHYIVYAFGRLGLAAATAFNAVNYLDRFLSINCHLRWEEAWMVELVSVACLSIACKLDEVNIPSLHDLQMEEVLSHSFRPATVRDMELTLLKALQWRLACVTPYSFLQLLLPITTTTTTTTTACCITSRLLLCSLMEPSLLLRFDSSVIAASALRCVVANNNNNNLIGVSSTDIISRLIRRHDCPMDKDGDECLKMMQALYASWRLLDLDTHHHLHSEQQWSPVSVAIPFQTHGATAVVNRSAVSHRRCLFGGGGSTQDHVDNAPN
ncbi:unnamed protein product [Urochloa humidicola]